MTKVKKDKQDIVIQELKALNEKLARQGSIKKIFFTGVIYGIGFFVGSAIIATILLGFFGPWVGKNEWVGENYERGSSLQ